MAIAGTQETATAEADTYRPTGLQIVDTRNWSVRMLDPRAEKFMVATGALLVTGPHDGLAAYGSDGSLRWRAKGLGEQNYLVEACRSLALVDDAGKLHLVDVDSGRVMHGPPPPAAGGLLLGSGSS